jgi:hypothetical protein
MRKATETDELLSPTEVARIVQVRTTSIADACAIGLIEAKLVSRTRFAITRPECDRIVALAAKSAGFAGAHAK